MTCPLISHINVSPHHSYVSCVVGCPYEGKVAPEKVAYVSSDLIYAASSKPFVTV